MSILLSDSDQPIVSSNSVVGIVKPRSSRCGFPTSSTPPLGLFDEPPVHSPFTPPRTPEQGDGTVDRMNDVDDRPQTPLAGSRRILQPPSDIQTPPDTPKKAATIAQEERTYEAVDESPTANRHEAATASHTQLNQVLGGALTVEIFDSSTLATEIKDTDPASASSNNNNNNKNNNNSNISNVATISPPYETHPAYASHRSIFHPSHHPSPSLHLSPHAPLTSTSTTSHPSFSFAAHPFEAHLTSRILALHDYYLYPWTAIAETLRCYHGVQVSSAQVLGVLQEGGRVRRTPMGAEWWV